MSTTCTAHEISTTGTAIFRLPRCVARHVVARDAARCAVSEADARDWQGALNRARVSRREAKRPHLRRLYSAIKAGTAPAGWRENGTLFRAAQAVGVECLAAFEAMGLSRWVACPHCKGDGISRGTDRGMACGICHGHGTVPARVVAEVAEHRRVISRKYGYSMI